MTATIADCYAILGIDSTADQDEVARAYRRRALETHPDQGGDAEEFLQVRHAWEVLGDPDSRAVYDAQHAGPGEPDAANDWTETPHTGSRSTETTVDGDGVDWAQVPWCSMFAGISFNDPRITVRSTLMRRLVRWAGLIVLAGWWWPGMTLIGSVHEAGMTVARVVSLAFPVLAIAATIMMIAGRRMIRCTLLMVGWAAATIGAHMSAHPQWCALIAGWVIIWAVLAWGWRLTRPWGFWIRKRVMSANIFGDPEPYPPQVEQIAEALASAIPAARVIWRPRGAQVAIAVDRNVAYLRLAGTKRIDRSHARYWAIEGQDTTRLVDEIGSWLLEGTGGFSVDPVTLGRIEAHVRPTR